MIAYFIDRKMNVLGLANTGLRDGFHITDDKSTINVETGTETMDLTVSFTVNNRAELEQMCEAGNYVFVKDELKETIFTIIDETIDVSNSNVVLYMEDAGLDLINDLAMPYTTSLSQNIEYYVNVFLGDQGYEIGHDDFVDSTLDYALSWNDESTIKERLLSLCKEFKAEMSFSFEIKGLSIVNKFINIYRKRGQDLDTELRLGRDISNITIKKSIANLATAYYCKGGQDDNGNTVTLQGYNYDDGDFYTDGKLLKSRKAVEKWGRFKAFDAIDTERYGMHIVKTFSFDTPNQTVLCGEAIDALKKVCDGEVNYEVTIVRLPDTIGIGDRVNIVDELGHLYLSSRVLSITKSVTQDTYTATLGDYKLKEGGIYDKVRELADNFKNYVDTHQNYYMWVAYADTSTGSGISLSPSGKRYVGIAYNRASATPDISVPGVYTWSAFQGNKFWSTQVTLTGSYDETKTSSALSIADGSCVWEIDGYPLDGTPIYGHVLMLYSDDGEYVTEGEMVIENDYFVQGTAKTITIGDSSLAYDGDKTFTYTDTSGSITSQSTATIDISYKTAASAQYVDNEFYWTLLRSDLDGDGPYKSIVGDYVYCPDGYMYEIAYMISVNDEMILLLDDETKIRYSGSYNWTSSVNPSEHNVIYGHVTPVIAARDFEGDGPTKAAVGDWVYCPNGYLYRISGSLVYPIRTGTKFYIIDLSSKTRYRGSDANVDTITNSDIDTIVHGGL